MLIVPSNWVPRGNAVYSTLSASINLSDTPDQGVTLPATADTAIIYVSGKDAHVNFDGADADTNDPKYPLSQFLVLENSRDCLVGFNAIESAASGRLDIWYFSVK